MTELGFEVGDASDGADAIRLAEVLEPDVILVDFTNPEAGGLGTIRQIKKRFPDIPVVMLVTSDLGLLGHQTLHAGVSGYVRRECSPEEIANKVRQLRSAARYFQRQRPLE